jgi:hypothetical protein
MVTIRRCGNEDVAGLLAFIETHWKPGHVFTLDRALFDWQHALVHPPGEYAFAVARENEHGPIVGVLGYIPTRRFDPSLASDNTVWLALWKVRDDAKASGVGLQLLKYVSESEPWTALGVIGFNADIVPLYQALGFTTGELRHYVLPDPETGPYALAKLHAPVVMPKSADDVTTVSVDADGFCAYLDGVDVPSRHGQAPGKTAVFFLNRYLRHPVYRYRCDIVFRDGHPIGLLATRVATHAGRKALRLVDYLGPDETVPALGGVILRHVHAIGAEYADVYNWGIAPELFARAGFIEIDPDGPDIVPDHFEPFEAANVRLRFAVKSKRPVVLFKGDGDQDRPSRITP